MAPPHRKSEINILVGAVLMTLVRMYGVFYGKPFLQSTFADLFFFKFGRSVRALYHRKIIFPVILCECTSR